MAGASLSRASRLVIRLAETPALFATSDLVLASPEASILCHCSACFSRRSSGKLLAQGEVLKGERAARGEDGAEEPGQEGNERAHGISRLLQPEMASIAQWIGFSRTTAESVW